MKIIKKAKCSLEGRKPCKNTWGCCRECDAYEKCGYKTKCYNHTEKCGQYREVIQGVSGKE